MVTPAGALVAVDAVRAVRVPPIFRNRPPAGAGGRLGGADRAEPVVRLLRDVLLAVCRRIRVV